MTYVPTPRKPTGVPRPQQCFDQPTTLRRLADYLDRWEARHDVHANNA